MPDEYEPKPAKAIDFQLVAPRVAYWEAFDGRIKTELCASAVLTASGLVLIDPILLTPEALGELTETAAPHAVVVTSENHWRAADYFRQRFSIPVYAHASAASEEGAPDHEVQEGDIIAGEMAVIEITGAAPGEIAVLHAGGSLHVGDALINAQPYGFSLLPDKYCENAKTMRDSLRKLLRHEFRLLLFAHGTPLVSGAQERLARLLA